MVGMPNMMDREGFLRDVDAILDTRIFTNLGPFATKLEKRVCSKLNVKHAFAISNATVGLVMALRALELSPGGEVILPSYTFVATAHAVQECGLTPIFCDCDPFTHLIGVDEVSACLTSKTVAILAVNLWGLACDVHGLERLSKERNLRLLFDSAHSFGARASCGRHVGNFGAVEVFSLHATKLFNSFEGGLITTNDDGVAEKLGPMRNFGITGQDQVSSWGSNYKLSEIHAAFALRQLAKLDELISMYRSNAAEYTRLLDLKDVKGVRLWNKDFLSDEGCTHAYVCLEIHKNFPICRDTLLSILREHEVFGKRYFYPGMHRCEPYSGNKSQDVLPVTEKLCGEVIVLPTGSQVHAEDIARIVEIIAASAHAQENVEGNETMIAIDSSSLNERMTYLRRLKLKYEELTRACEEDLKITEQLMSTFKATPDK